MVPPAFEVHSRRGYLMSAEISDPDLKDAEKTIHLEVSGEDSHMPVTFGMVFELGAIVDNRYKILEILGRGGMGTVYKVQHLIFNEVCALKVSSARLEPVSAQRFQREAVVAKLLDHEHIVKVTDFGLVDSVVPFFVMQYAQGPSLSDLIRQKQRLKLEEALEIFSQVSSAMAHAHDKGVIHRDLKPSNIIVGNQAGRVCVKVVDFGIAKLLSADEQGKGLTRTGEIFGSPPYMSPEQCLGAKVDHRADIYSFGCSLFESICGLPPFAGDTALHTMMLHQTGKAPTLKEASLGLVDEPALEKMLAKLLTKDPHDRYQSFDEVKVDLNLIRGGKQPLVASVPKASDLRERRSRKEMLPWIISIAILGLIAGSISVWFYTRQNVQYQKEDVPKSDNWIGSDMLAKVQPYASLYKDSYGRIWKRFRFPDHKNFGLLETMPSERSERKVYVAKDIVQVPADERLTLIIRNETVSNPNSLRGFGKDDLYGISAQKVLGAIDDKFVHDILPLTGLQALSLDLTEVTDTGFELIGKHMPNLKELSIGSTEITGEAVAKFPRLKKLVNLRMGGNSNGGLIFPALRGSKNLIYLSICDCQLKDSNLDGVNTLANLQTLMIRNNKDITDAGIAKLVGLKKLTLLELNGCSVTPACVKYLLAIPSLEGVSLPFEKWSAEDVAKFKAALPKKCKVVSGERPSERDPAIF